LTHPGGLGGLRRVWRPTRAALFALALIGALVLGARAEAKPVFGIVPQDGALPSASDLDLMPTGGIKGMRTMMPWATVESRQGVYDWSSTDAIIRETTSRGIAPLVFLYGTPEWAAKLDGRNCHGSGCAVYPPKSADTRAAFQAFATAAAKRYGPGGDFWSVPVNTSPTSTGTTETGDAANPADTGNGLCDLLPICPPPPPPPPPPIDPPLPGEPPCGCTKPSPITVWQIWNEQNSPKYFAPKVDIPAYAALLHSAATGIRAVDPQAEILLGGMWGPNSAREVVTPTRTYLQRLYRLGADRDFDSIGLHPYANDAKLSLAQLVSARRVMVRAGDREGGMWVTEIGWAGRGPRDNPYVKGLKGQARVLTQALSAYKRKARSFHLRGVFWYSWRDKSGGDSICDWCGHAGLRTKGGAAKPAWKAFVRIAR